MCFKAILLHFNLINIGDISFTSYQITSIQGDSQEDEKDVVNEHVYEHKFPLSISVPSSKRGPF